MEKTTVQVFNNSVNELPTYSTELSAGFDFRADLTSINSKSDLIGNGHYKYLIVDGKKEIHLEPSGGRVLIPTKLHMAIPDGYELQVRPRSGLALNHGISLVNSPGTIDCFSETSFITTLDGEKMIHDLKINDGVLSFNENTGEIEKDTIVCIKDTGNQDIYIIETDNGILEVTKNTLVYTKEGIKKAHELTEDDEIIIE